MPKRPNGEHDSFALTPRELEVLELLRLGLGAKQIATRLGIGSDTARRHSSRVKQKTHVFSTSALAAGSLVQDPGWLEQLDLHHFGVTGIERRVLQHLSDGGTSKQIARALGISHRTVDKHRENLLRKFGMQSTRQLTAWLVSQYAMCGISHSSDQT
ncbi:helix-turn-helix transcriptional regulator [Burkholderia contaminans]|uniref:response regulator transcription factor n=1 Tax=Burkholderia contaminans TaxID=488447 RepID=UPI00310CA4F3